MYTNIHPFKMYNSVACSIFTRFSNHRHFLIPEHVIISPKKTQSYKQSLSIALQWLIYFLLPYICLFWTLHVNRLIKYMTFCIWLFSVSVFSRFIHVAAFIRFHAFLWLNNISLYGYTIICLNIHLLMTNELFLPFRYCE